MEGSNALPQRDEDHDVSDINIETTEQARLRLVTEEGGALATAEFALATPELTEAYFAAHADNDQLSAAEGESMVEEWYGEGFQN